MNKLLGLSIIILLLTVTACNNKKQAPIESERDSIAANLYLGATPPGVIPTAFAPGLVTTDGWEYGGVFTPDLQEFYFIRQADSAQEFVRYKNVNNIWQETVVSPRVGQPYIAPDGKTMHLGRRYKERTATGWSEVKMLSSPFDSLLIMRLTASASGTYFFDEFKEDMTGDIRYSNLVDGARQEPTLLGPTVNAGNSFHPFIAPDESYLIFDATREGGYGDSDLYISFKQDDGSFGVAINLGDKINTPAWEAAATVTPDGKYLFFNRNIGSAEYENVNIMWVDMKFLDDLIKR